MMRFMNQTSLDLWDADRNPVHSPVAPPPKLYTRQDMPIVDVHMHIHPWHYPDNDLLKATAAYVETMDASGIQVAVNLLGTVEAIAQVDALHEISKG